MSSVNDLVEKLNNMNLTEVLDAGFVQKQFVHVYNTLWGSGGEAAYEKESAYFKSILRDNDRLRKCAKFSIYLSFIDLAVSGLSLEPGPRALAYVIPRNYKIGKNERGMDVYEARCTLSISAYGELVTRKRAGQIRHADNPVVVYANDSFSYGETNGQKTLSYTCNLPHTGQPIVACYIKITRADGTIDYSVMLQEGWERLKNYSIRNNTYFDSKNQKMVSYANPLYGSEGKEIDTGFLCAKCIKHAFISYPKVRIGKYTVMETESLEKGNLESDMTNYYGVEDHAEEDEEPKKEEPADFAPEPDKTSGVVINENEDDDDVF